MRSPVVRTPGWLPFVTPTRPGATRWPARWACPVRRCRSAARRAYARRRDDRHARPLARATGAGRHRGRLPRVLREALGRRTADAQRIAQAAADRPVLLGVDYNRRFACGYRDGPPIARRGCDWTTNAGHARRQRRHAAGRRGPASLCHLHHAADAPLRFAALVRRRSQPTAGNRRPQLQRHPGARCHRRMHAGRRNPGHADSALCRRPATHARADGSGGNTRATGR